MPGPGPAAGPAACEAGDADGVRARAGTSSTTAPSRRDGHHALRPRQPHLVLPVAALPRRGAAPAGGWSRSTSSAWAGPSALDGRGPWPSGSTTSAAAHRRPGHHRPGRDRRPRLGRPDLARLGAGATATSCAASCSPTPPCTSRPAPPRPSLIRLARTPRPASDHLRRVRRRSSAPPPRCPGRPAGGGARRARRALRAPPARRQAVGDFVADIPLDADHPSRRHAGRGSRTGLGALADVPVLLLWGPRDPVFSDRYLRDLLGRLPHAEVHRYEGASHLVTEDAPARRRRRLGAGSRTSRGPPPASATSRRGRPAAPPLWAGLLRPRGRPRRRRSWSWAGATAQHLASPSWTAGSRDLAAGLAAAGVRPGDRVALLVPPGVDLTAAVYACWRAGAVIVVADAGLGLRAMGRALRGAGPDHLIGIGQALAAAARHAGAGAPDRRRRRWTRATPPRPSAPGTAWPTWPGSAADRDLPAPPRTTPSAPSCSPPAPPARPRAWSTGTARCRPSCDVLRSTYGLTRRRPARRRLRAVRALRPRAGPGLGRARHGRHRAGHPDRRRAGRRRRGRRRDRGLRLAGGAAQRRGHRRRPDRGAPRAPWPGPAADVRRRAGPGRRCCRRSRELLPQRRRCTRRTA